MRAPLTCYLMHIAVRPITQTSMGEIQSSLAGQQYVTYCSEEAATLNMPAHVRRTATATAWVVQRVGTLALGLQEHSFDASALTKRQCVPTKLRIADCDPPPQSGYIPTPATYCTGICWYTDGALIFLHQKKDLRCDTCRDYLNLIVTIFHECIHAKTCRQDEKSAYCNEFRFLMRVLLNQNPGGPCTADPNYIGIVEEMSVDALRRCFREEGRNDPWPTDRPR